MASCGWCGLWEVAVGDLFDHVQVCRRLHRVNGIHGSILNVETWRKQVEEQVAAIYERFDARQIAALLALRDSLGLTRVRSTLVVSVPPETDTHALWDALSDTLKLFDGEILKLDLDDGL